MEKCPYHSHPSKTEVSEVQWLIPGHPIKTDIRRILSGRWLKSPAMCCPDFVHQNWSVFHNHLDMDWHGKFLPPPFECLSLTSPPKSCHSKPPTPPSSTSSSISGLPTVDPHWEIQVLVTTTSYFECGGRLSLAPTPELWVCQINQFLPWQANWW